jgi:uncharacterized protein YjiS (DUF1127 family)
MTVTEISQFNPFPLGRKSSPLHILMESALRGLGALAKEISRRQAVGALRELDDCALRDIGLARSQIEAAVYGFKTAPDQARI